MTALRKELHDYVDRVDESFLRVLKAMIKEHLRNAEDELDLSAGDLKEIDQRKKLLLSGKDKGVDAYSISKIIRAEIKKRRK